VRPESLMMSYGYRPELSEGAIKPPLFMTSTFVFKTAEEGKAFFELAYGLRKGAPGEEIGLIYSRLNNPDLEILEDRLTLWDGRSCRRLRERHGGDQHDAADFPQAGRCHPVQRTQSTAAPISCSSTSCRALASAQSACWRTCGTAAFEQAVQDRSVRDHVAMIYVETPANPTNALVDIAACAALARRLSQPGRQVVLRRRQHLPRPALAAPAPSTAPTS
jgi:methionine-gamma-lyase